MLARRMSLSCRSRALSEGHRACVALAGFSLIEILLVLAIMGLLAGVLISGSTQLLSGQPQTVHEVFWQAVQEARKDALRHEREVTLRFVDDREKTVKKFVVQDGGEAQDFPIPPSAGSSDLTVDFLPGQKTGSMAIIAGMVLEKQPLAEVTFYPDGTCTAFRVQIVRNAATHMLAIDPWTCAPVLTPPDPYASRF